LVMTRWIVLAQTLPVTSRCRGSPEAPSTTPGTGGTA
jgi:hypothetical protein